MVNTVLPVLSAVDLFPLILSILYMTKRNNLNIFIIFEPTILPRIFWTIFPKLTYCSNKLFVFTDLVFSQSIQLLTSLKI